MRKSLTTVEQSTRNKVGNNFRQAWFSTVKDIPFFVAAADLLTSAGLKDFSIITGGGVASFTGHLANAGVKTQSASGELATVGHALGWARALKPGRSGSGGTLGVGAAQQADPLHYASSGHALPTLVVVGDNSDGRTGPASFQPVDVTERYNDMFAGRVTKFTPGKPEQLRVQLGQAAKQLEEAYVAGEPVLWSVPQNMAAHKVSKYSVDEQLLALELGYSRPKTLSADAAAQLQQMVAAINGDNTRVLFVLGEGLASTIRMEGRQVHKLAGQVMDKIAGNRIATSDWQDMLHGHAHELPPASHNYDAKIQKGVAQANVVVFLGCGPNATLTGLQNGLTHFTQRGTQCFMIDSSAARLNKWKNDGDLKKANISYIHAPMLPALEYLMDKDYEHTRARHEIAGRIASEVHKEVFEGQQQVLGAQKVRDIAFAATHVIEGFQEQGMKVGLAVSSGDASSQVGLRYRSRALQPGSLFYPNEGILGVTLSAARGMADTGDFDRVVAIMGDGEAGYTTAELGYLAQAGCPVVCVVLNNQCWEAVEKARRPGTEHVAQHMERYGKTVNTHYAKMAAVFPEANMRGFSVEGSDSKGIATALTEALKHNGPSIVEVNIRGLEREKVLGGVSLKH